MNKLQNSKISSILKTTNQTPSLRNNLNQLKMKSLYMEMNPGGILMKKIGGMKTLTKHPRLYMQLNLTVKMISNNTATSIPSFARPCKVVNYWEI